MPCSTARLVTYAKQMARELPFETGGVFHDVRLRGAVVIRDFAERTLRNVAGVEDHSPFYARRPDHLAPLLGKFDNEFAELGG
jgi:hypothetical protein